MTNRRRHALPSPTTRERARYYRRRLALVVMLLNRAGLISSRVAFSLLPSTREITSTTTRTTAIQLFSASPSPSSSSSPTVLSTSAPADDSTSTPNRLVLLSENQWRSAARRHSQRIEALLRPGLLVPSSSSSSTPKSTPKSTPWTALDPNNPIYNFLIEYYGLKGTKGVRRLARWSPDPKLLLSTTTYYSTTTSAKSSCHIIYYDDNNNDSFTVLRNNDELHQAAMEASHGLGGILLLNATMDDLGSTLHLRGGVPVPLLFHANPEEAGGSGTSGGGRKRNGLHGILYNPSVFYNDLRIASSATTIDTILDTTGNNNNEDNGTTLHPRDDDRRQRTMAPYQWYASILETTLNSEPVLHCHGLHEWAMLYHPTGSDPPPSAAYQPNLPLRVAKHIINDAVERAGIRCTHVDALRFFAPDALPLNRHVNLTRMDQLHLEQKACVHAHMDLLKMALKLSPFVDSRLLGDVLEVALEARRLDVAASPYDASAYGLDPVPVETREGRKMYRREQAALMTKAESVRRRLLRAYEVFMELAFLIQYESKDEQGKLM